MDPYPGPDMYPSPDPPHHPQESELCIEDLLVRIHFMIGMIRWTGLAPWDFECPFPGSLTSTFLYNPQPQALNQNKTIAAEASSTSLNRSVPGSGFVPGSGSTP